MGPALLGDLYRWLLLLAVLERSDSKCLTCARTLVKRQIGTQSINRARAVLRGDGHNVPKTTDPWKWLEKHDIELSRVTQAIIESCRHQREVFEDEIDALAMELRHFAFENDMARWLTSLADVGPMVAAAIVAYIGDPSRFKKAKQVVRYAGLDASAHQSGEEHWRGRISKNGPALLRKLLVQAAHRIVRCNQGPLAEFYRRKVKEIGHRRAIIALARKLLIAVWHLMQTDRLAHELEDDKARKGYERTLREIKRDIAKADERLGTGVSCAVTVRNRT